MKFVISTEEFNALINKIQNVVPQKPTMPILSNLLIEASEDELTLTATDLIVGMRCNKEVQIIEEGATTLPAKRFAQLLRELTSLNVEISTANDVTTVKAGSSRFKLNGMNKNGYPSLPDLSQGQSFHIKQSELKELLYRASFAVSREDNRYVLTGLLMQIVQGQIYFIGTDGKRLARVHAAIEIDPNWISQSIVPLKAIEEIFKNLSEEGEAKITIMADKIAVEVNHTHLLTKLLSGEYPDISRIIPEQCEILISLHREELISLLRQVSLFTEPFQSTRFIFEEGELKLISNAAEIGEGHVGMPVNYHGPKLEIAFNPGFFLDILRHCREEIVTLGLIDTYNPGMITDGHPPAHLSQASPLFIIMPMRLSED